MYYYVFFYLQAIAEYYRPAGGAWQSGALPYPARLSAGYLLDKQGINTQVAFTSYTMEEYAGLQEAPGLQELYDKIVDKDPLLMMCCCGNRSQYKALEESLNQLIAGGLESCQELTLGE